MYNGIYNVCQYKIVLNNYPCSTISLEIDPLMQTGYFRLMTRVMKTIKFFLIPPTFGREGVPPVQGWSNGLGLSEILRLGRNIRISLCLKNHFNADLSLQQDCDHLIAVFRDPRILEFSTESHFNLLSMPEIILFLQSSYQ